MTNKKYRKNRRKDSPAARKEKKIARIARFLKFAGFLTSIAAMSALFIFGHDLLTQCDYFKAEKIRIEGIRRLSEDQIKEQAGVAEGVNILSVNLSVARKRLMAHPWIRDARVGREFPDTISVRIAEHRPFAILDLGARFIMNSNGEIFKAREPGDPDHLPVVHGLAFSDLKTSVDDGSKRYASVMEVLRLGESPDSAVPNGMIRRIDVDRQMGLSLGLAGNNKVVRLGYGNYSGKYSRLQRVVFHLKAGETFSDFNSIDLTNPDSIVVYPVKTEGRNDQDNAGHNKEA